MGTSSAHDIRISDDVCYASDNLRSACGYIGFGAGNIISEHAGTDNLFHASYNIRCANCSGDLRFASCAYHLNDVDASANIHGTSSAHDIPCASCAYHLNDVDASDNLSSTCCSNDIPSSTNDLPRTRHGLRSAYNV